MSLAIVLVLAVAAACGSKPATPVADPNSSTSSTVEETMPKTTKKMASVSEFCDALKENLEPIKTPGSDFGAFVDALKELRKTTTREIKPSLDRMIKGTEPLVGLSGDERANAAEDLKHDREFNDALDEFEIYVSDKCDVRLTTTSRRTETTRRTATSRRSSSSTAPSQSGQEILADLQDFLATKYGSTPWFQAASKVAVNSGSSGVSFKLTVDPALPVTESVAACEGVADFADSKFDDAAVNIVDPAGTVLAHRTNKAGGCGSG